MGQTPVLTDSPGEESDMGSTPDGFFIRAGCAASEGTGTGSRGRDAGCMYGRPPRRLLHRAVNILAREVSSRSAVETGGSQNLIVESFQQSGRQHM
jgi:hypothetical protein